MQALGLDALFRGSNFLRLLGGLWKALEISIIAVALSLVLGVLLGIVMTSDKLAVRIISRIYLETVRIMPQSTGVISFFLSRSMFMRLRPVPS